MNDLTTIDTPLLIPGERIDFSIISNLEGEAPGKQGWTLLTEGKVNSLWWRRSDEGERANEIAGKMFDAYIDRVRAHRARQKMGDES